LLQSFVRDVPGFFYFVPMSCIIFVKHDSFYILSLSQQIIHWEHHTTERRIIISPDVASSTVGPPSDRARHRTEIPTLDPELNISRQETKGWSGRFCNCLYRGQDGVQVRAFRRALIEEPETREAGQSKEPELYRR
jgi:hypothetical protein